MNVAKITFENKAVDLKAYPYYNNSINIKIEDREYTETEILDILKKHKEEEDKKYPKCYKCGKKYLENNRFNMVSNNLEQIMPVNKSYAVGYQTTPYITGFKILSKSGQGREINLCDDCIFELIKWLNEKE